MEIERSVVINLDRDARRLENFYQALPTGWPFPKPIRFSAMDGSCIPRPPWWVANDASWGCFRSHQGVIEQALNDQVESLLILEDDALCHPDFEELFTAFSKELPSDWQWVYLGGQHIQRELGLPIPISEHVYRPYNAHRAHAYVFRGKEVMRKVAAHLLDRQAWGEKHHVDHRLGEMHAGFPSGLYCPDRWLVGQAAGFSNIKQRHLEATFFPDARSFYDLDIKHPFYVVLGNCRRHRLIVAALLHRLGVSFGASRPPESIEQAPDSYCAPGLDTMCDQLIRDPFWYPANDETFRVAHLKMWAERRCHANTTSSPMGATQTKLMLLHREIRTAWPQTRFVLVDVNEPTAPIGFETVHHSRLASAFREIQDTNGCHRITNVEFDDPDTLVDRLVNVVGANLDPSDVATAKVLAMDLCPRL